MIVDDYWKMKFCGPLAPYVDGLREELSALAYAPSTVTSHLAVWSQLSGWLARQGPWISPKWALHYVLVSPFLVGLALP